MDSDDYVEESLCERLYKEMNRTNADIIVFGANIFPKKVVEYEKWLLDTLEVKEAIYIGNCEQALFREKCSKPFLWNKCYKRELLEKNNIQFHKDIKLGQDNLFQFMVFPRADKVVFITDILYNYRCMREGSAMYKLCSDSEWKVQMHIEIMENVLATWFKLGILEKYANELYNWCIYFVVKEVEKSQISDAKRHKLLKSIEAKMKQYGLV